MSYTTWDKVRKTEETLGNKLIPGEEKVNQLDLIAEI